MYFLMTNDVEEHSIALNRHEAQGAEGHEALGKA